MTHKTWFITGTSRGFGREWTIAALERGDHVAATARSLSSLEDLAAKYGDALLPIQLDVTDRDAVFAAVRQAHSKFGRLDIVVNNAGYGQFGFVEELTEQEAREQIDTNLFGALWVTQAALPFLREQGSGHILQVSSIGGITAFGGLGMYHASKWALEGLSQALAQEVAAFGIKLTIIEPAAFSTDWGGASARHTTSFRTTTRSARSTLASEPRASGCRAIPWRPEPPCCKSSMPRSHRCASFSATARSRWRLRTTSRGWLRGGSGNRFQSRPRA